MQWISNAIGSSSFLVSVLAPFVVMGTLVCGCAAPRRAAPQPEWNLEHEHAAWERLFGDVRRLLDRDRERLD